MDFPEKIFVARKYVSHNQVDAYIIDATKSHTKAFQTKKEKLEYWTRTNALPSLILDNTPLKGFAVVQKLTTHSNITYFTIRHPEGFEFNVSASNMNDLIAHNDIIKGVFQDEMFFNKNMELINGKTKTFALMVDAKNKEEERKEIASKLKVGDGFRLRDLDYYYCGKVHAICLKKTREFTFPDKSSIYNLVYCITDGTYALNNRLDKYDIAPRASNNSKTTTANEILKANEFWQSTTIRKTNLLTECNTPILVHDKPFKKNNLKIRYDAIKPCDIMSSGRFNENVPFMSESEGKHYRVFFGVSDVPQSRGSYYYGRNTDYVLKYKEDFERFSAYPVEIDENGIMSMDVDLDTHQGFSSWRSYNSPFYPPTLKYSASNRQYSASNRQYSVKSPHVQLAITNPLYIGKYYL